MLEKYTIKKANVEEFDHIKKIFEAVKEDLKKREIIMWIDK